MQDFVFFAAAQGQELGGGVANSIVQNFGVDAKVLIGQAINFTIVALILWKFAFGPLMKVVDARQEEIQDGLQYAEEMKARLAEAEKQGAEKLKEASVQAAQLTAQARQGADDFLAQQKEQALSRYKQIIEKANEDIEQERRQMMMDARNQIAGMVVQASAKVLDRELSDQERGRFTTLAAETIK